MGEKRRGISGRSRGETRPPPPYLKTKLRPEGLRKIFFETGSPLSQGLDDRPPPPPLLSEGLDPPMGMILL